MKSARQLILKPAVVSALVAAEAAFGQRA